MVRRRAAAIAAFEQALSADEAYLVPTCPILAPPLSSVRDDAGFHRMNGLVLRNPRIANLLDCPSISLPVPSAGLPVGLMLIGRRAADRQLLAMAAALEGAVPHQPRSKPLLSTDTNRSIGYLVAPSPPGDGGIRSGMRISAFQAA